MRSALKSLLFTFLLAATNTWAAPASPQVQVTAIVGEAVVVFEDIECPDTEFRVPTGERVVTNPVTCETLSRVLGEGDKYDNIIWAIAETDFSNPDEVAALEAKIVEADLSVAEAVLVLVGVQNNPQHLGTDDSTVIEAAALIAGLNGDVVGPTALAITAINPGISKDLTEALVVAAPDRAEEARQGGEKGKEIVEELTEGAPPPDPGDTGESGGEGEPEGEGEAEPQGEAEPEGVEVISVTDSDSETPPETEAPPPPPPPPPAINTEVPPGGSIPDTSPPSPE